MKLFTSGAVIVLALCTTSCASIREYDRHGQPRADASGKDYVKFAPMDPNRRIVQLNCRDSYSTDGGNLRCM